MTLKQIEAFYWAANLGSFSIAANRLHVTQSSLSKRIAELEESVGAPLFDRSSRRAQLTECGQRLIALAGQMLDLSEQFRAIDLTGARLTGVCRFGVSELISLTWLPTFTRMVNRDHPALVLEPYVDLARHLERKVVRGELDFAVAPGPGQGAQVTAKVVGRVDFTWVASPGRIDAGTVLSRQELERHPVITMTEGSGLTRAIEVWSQEQGITLQRTLGCNSLMAIVALVLADMGISFLPSHFMKPWLKEGTLVALNSEPSLPSLNYCFFHRADDSRTLLETMQDYVARATDFQSPPECLTSFAKSQND
ncbi:LysR family transcriptional regulator [Pigmentiphaga litoralis]|uniref:LysR family transcriptional regulator n=1 Tax=Pigmentiphaga litoralis TaxID=516702 RepID=UPI001671C7D3|nr:LysR family transcriptional regulator [Pigmentiphaga litoralis]GGX18934.1 LysR family transcriptional regulator [Pigmentiphaga litoralis]